MSVICVSDMMDKDYKQYVLSSVEKEARGGIYIVSTDRDVPLIWVCFFSDLVRVWVDNSCSRYLHDP